MFTYLYIQMTEWNAMDLLEKIFEAYANEKDRDHDEQTNSAQTLYQKIRDARIRNVQTCK